MSSWNDVTKKVRELRKNFAVRCVISFVAVLASALLQSYVILAFIRPAGLLSSGFTGLAILIDRIAELYGFSVSTSLALVVLNLPVGLLCCRTTLARLISVSESDRRRKRKRQSASRHYAHRLLIERRIGFLRAFPPVCHTLNPQVSTRTVFALFMIASSVS